MLDFHSFTWRVKGAKIKVDNQLCLEGSVFYAKGNKGAREAERPHPEATAILRTLVKTFWSFNLVDCFSCFTVVYYLSLPSFAVLLFGVH